MILHHQFRRVFVIAAIYLAAFVVLDELRQHHLVGAEAAVRLRGMLSGLVVLVYANAIPKTLVPLARLSCAPAREQTLRRVFGWAGVLGSLAYTLAYALAPIAIAGKLANALLTPAVVVMTAILVRCAWRGFSARRRATWPPRSQTYIGE